MDYFLACKYQFTMKAVRIVHIPIIVLFSWDPIHPGLSPNMSDVSDTDQKISMT